MATNPNNLDWLERLMAEAAEAEQAGVFHRTEVSDGALTGGTATRPSWFRRHHHAIVGLPVAACLAFMAVLGTLHYGVPAGPTPVVVAPVGFDNNSTSISSPVAGHRLAEELMSCFAGPGSEPLSTECASADLDSDGDVDLADFSALQLAEASGPIR